MSLKNSTKFYFLFLTAITVTNVISASKCGDFFCDENSECQYDIEKLQLNCVCGEGYIKNSTGKYIHCHQLENVGGKERCLNVGDKCGPSHECSADLICLKISDEHEVEIIDTNQLVDLVCKINEKKCFNKCCLENEICQNGIECKAKVSQLSLDSICPEALRCLEKCCTENETCTQEKLCVPMEESAVVVNEITSLQCSESQNCQNKCCAANEQCLNGEECVSKDIDIVVCPETQKCQDKCCDSDEICQSGYECVPKDSVELDCPERLFCLDRCCADNEECVEGACVGPKPISITITPNYPASIACDGSQRCQDKCCAQNELCVNEGECIPKEECPNDFRCDNKCCAENEICDKNSSCILKVNECPKSLICQEKCCDINQICSDDHKCIDAFDCLPAQKCHDKCCTAQEICTDKNECISVHILDCPEAEKCDNRCCAVDETCNEDNECVAYLEVQASENCPPERKCLHGCCEPTEICSQLNECVNKILEDISNLYDFPHIMAENKTKIANNFDTIVPIFDFENAEKKINCPSDYVACQHNCCTIQQNCHTSGECVEKHNGTACALGGNCVEKASSVNNTKNTSVAYTMIGLGCLVAVLSFSLFKAYNFRRMSRNVFWN